MHTSLSSRRHTHWHTHIEYYNCITVSVSLYRVGVGAIVCLCVCAYNKKHTHTQNAPKWKTTSAATTRTITTTSSSGHKLTALGRLAIYVPKMANGSRRAGSIQEQPGEPRVPAPAPSPFPFPLHFADNHSKLHKCMANKCEASERSSRKPPGAARHCRCQSRCRCWASILASTHHVRFGALGLDTQSHTHTRTSTPACSCKLKQRRLAFKCKRRAAKKLTNTTQIEKP